MLGRAGSPDLTGCFPIGINSLAKSLASLITSLCNVLAGDLNEGNKHPDLFFQNMRDSRSLSGPGLDEDQGALLSSRSGRICDDK